MKLYKYTENLFVLDMDQPLMAIITPINVTLDKHTPDPDKLFLFENTISALMQNMMMMHTSDLAYAVNAIISHEIQNFGG